MKIHFVPLLYAAGILPCISGTADDNETSTDTHGSDTLRYPNFFQMMPQIPALVGFILVYSLASGIALLVYRYCCRTKCDRMTTEAQRHPLSNAGTHLVHSSAPKPNTREGVVLPPSYENAMFDPEVDPIQTPPPLYEHPPNYTSPESSGSTSDSMQAREISVCPVDSPPPGYESPRNDRSHEDEAEINDHRPPDTAQVQEITVRPAV